MTLDLPTLALFAGLVLLLAGFVKGVVGLGLPTISMGLLGLVMTPVEAAAILVIPNLVTNVWQLATGPSFKALSRRVAPMMVGVVAGTALGALMMPGGAQAWATPLLGAALAIYAALGLLAIRMRVSPRCELWAGPLVGAATGVITVATGVFVIPAVPYLQALDLDKDDLVQALGLSFLVSSLALALALIGDGAFEVRHAGATAARLPPRSPACWSARPCAIVFRRRRSGAAFSAGSWRSGCFSLQKGWLENFFAGLSISRLVRRHPCGEA